SLPGLLEQFTGRALASRPVTVCVLGLLAAVFLSHAAHGSLYDARMAGFAFLKVVLYYLLLIANVNTLARLRTFLAWLAGCVFVLAVLALLQYHEAVDIPSLSALEQRELNDESGEAVFTRRLRSTGI